MNLRKCSKCGAIISVFNECTCDNCGIKCCGEVMQVINANVTDASFEKHVPEYEIENDNIIVKVNHVMEEDHYIEWISYIYENTEQVVYFKPSEKSEATFKYQNGGVIYSYCNKHFLWSKEVD